MKDVRFRDGEGFEGKCERCLDWWPVDGDYWDPRRGLARCRACLLEADRTTKRLLRTDEAYKAREAEWARRYYAARNGEARERYREAHARRQRVRYHTDPIFREQRQAQAKAYADANREKVRAANREWYRRQREQAA